MSGPIHTLEDRHADLLRAVQHMTRVALSGSEGDGCEDECRSLLAAIAALGILAQEDATP